MGPPILKALRALRMLPIGSGNPPNGIISVGGGRETNRDSLSSGERKGKSPNQTSQGNLRGMWCYGPGFLLLGEVEVAWNGPP